MADKYDGFRIGTTRASWHDYDIGVYFVTICTKDRLNYLGQIDSENCRMELSPIGAYTHECILKISSLHPQVSVPVFQIMPNHVHLLVHIKETQNSTRNRVEAEKIQGLIRDNATRVEGMVLVDAQGSRLSRIITGFKGAVTKYGNVNHIPFAWQSRFHDRIVRNNDEYSNIANYIRNNVSTWVNDCFYRDLMG